MTNAELQALVASYMHRTDLTADIPGFIELARTRINRDMRVRENIKEDTETPTTNPRTLPLDFLEMRSIYFLPSTRRVTLTLVGREALNANQQALNATQRPSVFQSMARRSKRSLAASISSSRRCITSPSLSSLLMMIPIP